MATLRDTATRLPSTRPAMMKATTSTAFRPPLSISRRVSPRLWKMVPDDERIIWAHMASDIHCRQGMAASHCDPYMQRMTSVLAKQKNGVMKAPSRDSSFTTWRYLS